MFIVAFIQSRFVCKVSLCHEHSYLADNLGVGLGLAVYPSCFLISTAGNQTQGTRVSPVA